MSKPALTPEEEVRFDELFAPSDRLSLSHDWGNVLHREIAKTHAEPGFSPAPSADVAIALLESDELAAKRTQNEAKSAPSRFAFMAVACVLLVALIGGFVALQSSQASDQITLIPASQEVPAPEFSEVSIPEGTTSVLQAGDGTTVAVVHQPDAGNTVLALSDDLETWTETTPVPAVGFDPTRGPIVDISTDTWFVVGGDPESLFDAGPGRIAQNFATAVAVFSSIDRGQSWTQIESSFGSGAFERAHGEPLPAFSAETVLATSAAVLGDRIVVLIDTLTLTNWTEAARSAGIVDSETQVFLSGPPPFPGSDNDEQMFVAAGPGGIREVMITAADLGLPEEAFEELKVGLFFSPLNFDDPDQSVFGFFVSNGGDSFERAPDPRIGAFPTLFTQGERFVVQAENPISFPDSFLTTVRVSTDAMTWSEPDGNAPVRELVYAFAPQQDAPQEFGTVIDSDLWRLRIEPGSEDTVRLEQSNGGRTGFSLAPTPNPELQPELAFTTDFGAAVVWQTVPETAPVATVSENGWAFEADINNATFRLTDPDGNQSGLRGIFGTNFDNVVIDGHLTVWVFDDDGSEVASFDFDEVLAEVLRSPLETPTERVVSWATGPSDWRFADLDGLSTFLWDFQPLDEGLLATAADDSTEALLIEWPDGFEG